MKIINLVNKEESEIDYTINNFPDGQRDIVIIGFKATDEKEWGKNLKDIPIQIKSRLNNAENLLMIVCATKALRNLGVKEIHLYVPYILGLRSDRLFQEGGNRYVKDIIAPILNTQNYESVTCIDAHSYVAENCIDNLISLSNLDLVKWVFMNHPHNTKSLEDYILVSPDAGASHKIYKLAEQIGYKGDIITCSKERGLDGKLSKCVVPMGKYWNDTKDVIIIDDIADGAGTFINIAKEMKANGYKGKLYLVVTHGIFSKGFEELSKYFNDIYCTNSYKDIIKSENYKEVNFNEDFVKQLNVY